MLVGGFARKEVLLLVSKLTGLAEDAGLKDWEVEKLIAVRSGVWPITAARFDLWIPTQVQERRLRMLVEVLHNVICLFGVEAGRWLRQRNPGLGISPARFMLGEDAALAAVRDALREELGLF